MTIPLLYCKDPNTEYFNEGPVVYHRTPNGVRKVIEILPEDNPKNVSAEIAQLGEFENHIVMVLNWPILRNVFCFKKDTDELFWRLPAPPNVWKTRENYWCEIQADISKYPDRVYCYTVDNYRCVYEVSTMRLIEERYPTSGDPRDF